ncbi:MAG: ABC transporter ATP-binding protein [Candidatus Promineifilaceae bacterium]
MNDAAIRVEGLYRHFGDTKAVDGISFTTERGEIFSLLGPNGAGKSTTLSILACLLQPDRGEAWVMGHSVTEDPRDVKAAIGVVPQEIALYEDLSARENLIFWGKMYGMRGSPLKQRVDEVLDLVGLTKRQKERVGKYSGGMKRRVNLAIALLHKPPLIIMDEPTVGIDPQSRRHILDGVKELNREGISVLYTTHYMEEAQELSNHIAIMDEGKLVATGTHEELVEIVGEQDRIDLHLSHEPESVLDSWRELKGVSQVSATDSSASLLVDDSNRVLPQVFEVATSAGLRITSVEIQEPNLETVFLHLTGRELRD